MDNFVTQHFSQYLTNFHGMSLILVLFAFLGGLLSSLSPCSLGLLPLIISYVGGQNEKKSWRLYVQVFFFIVGLALTLTVIGVICAATGQIFYAQSRTIWVLILASMILVMGLQMMEVISLPIPAVVKELPKNTHHNLFFIPLSIGAAFALGTTPCSTPILASIMAFASLESNLFTGAVLLFTFSMGQGLILLIAALFTDVFKKVMKLQKYSALLMKASGLVLVLFSLYIYYQIFSRFI